MKRRLFDKLLSLSTPAICGAANYETRTISLAGFGAIATELIELLHRRNGFYAFESSLLVRPLQHKQPPLGLLEWNSPTLWKREYLGNLEDALFFAEDVFGVQFCLRDEKVCRFDPESGLMESKYSSILEWIRDVCAHYNTITGYPLGHAWQAENGILPAGKRLLPKKPFVLGGQFAISNLYSLEDVEGMKFRASIANHIRDLPDGSPIVIDVLKPKKSQ